MQWWRIPPIRSQLIVLGNPCSDSTGLLPGVRNDSICSEEVKSADRWPYPATRAPCEPMPPHNSVCRTVLGLRRKNNFACIRFHPWCLCSWMSTLNILNSKEFLSPSELHWPIMMLCKSTHLVLKKPLLIMKKYFHACNDNQSSPWTEKYTECKIITIKWYFYLEGGI